MNELEIVVAFLVGLESRPSRLLASSRQKFAPEVATNSHRRLGLKIQLVFSCLMRARKCLWPIGGAKKQCLQSSSGANQLSRMTLIVVPGGSFRLRSDMQKGESFEEKKS